MGVSMKWRVAAASVAFWAATAANAGTLVEDAGAFGVRPAAEQVAISPSGDRILMLVPGRGAQTSLKVFHLLTGEERTILSAPGTPETLRWCRFGSETQIVCRYGGNLMVDGLLLGFGRLIRIGVDGTGLAQLGQRSSFYDAGVRQFDGQVLDWVTNDGGSVLMAREYMKEAGRTGTRMSRSKRGLGVDRIDLLTLKSEEVEPPRPEYDDFVTDGRGHVRIRTDYAEDSSGILSGQVKYQYRGANGGDWQALGTYDQRNENGMQPLAIEAESNSLFYTQKLNGRDALYRMVLDGSNKPELVAKNDAVDIDGVTRFGRGQKVIGYTFATDKREVVYFDREFDGLSQSLGNAIPNLPIISFSDSSSDGTKLLIFAGSDTNPGGYYFLDRKTKEMSPLFDARPALAKRTLSPVKPITYRAADGTSIPAYLTLPPGSAGKKLAAVVLPHGGPSSRDEWGFDWLAQFLAARGYAVIQPNYRGSSGYGDDFQGANGFKDWRKAISDVNDSARYLVDQGIADPAKLAIVGWSYGGYAALQAAAVEPTRYKAVAAIAPVTDLALLKREADEYTSSQMVRDFVGSGEHVREGSPLQNASSITAPVLLVHGDLDLNVGVQHSVKMASALQGLGRPVEFLRFKDLDHQLDDSQARIQMLTQIGAQLQKALGQ
ncbi:S9 family peptidase [Sphingomonas sp. NSE70-1]|uniref:S9 family peptidase n=1 Tax=Sphingomonas caseinilyticus TaxID=2908205 RepID=A0ABT0RS61_9SPHN|nr:S9 family peptidase [Sphingomonas caseinilyticus]MCL6697849.1 S9 family peptidase [Sphingomonas caseinilyticus]